MRKIVIMLFVLMLISSVGFAAPLTDYKAGKTAIDVTFFPSMGAHLTNDAGYDQSPKSEGSFDFGATVGLGKGFALQYKQFNPLTKVFNGAEQIRLYSQELNLLKQIVNTKETHAAIFAGVTRAKVKDFFMGSSSSSDESNHFQVGLVINHKIAEKTSLFGRLGFSTDLLNSEVGVAYAASKNIDLNLSYRFYKVQNLEFPTVNVHSEFQGVGIGVTAKF